MTDFPPQLPHGDLVEVLPDVFFVTGQMVLEFDDTRRQFSRNMVVVRDGHDLTLVNTLRVDDAGLAHLDSLGTVKNIVRIGGFHGRDDAFYIDRYNAAFWAPNGIKFGRGEVPDGTLANDQPGPVTDSSVFLFETANRPEAILHLTRSGSILITCDSLQNWAEADEYFDAPTIKTMGAAGFLKPANVGPGWRNAAKPEASDFRRLMEMPFQHLLSAHGTPLLGSAKEAVGTTLAGLFDL